MARKNKSVNIIPPSAKTWLLVLGQRKVLGNIEIGDNVSIGAGSIVLRNVSADSVLCLWLFVYEQMLQKILSNLHTPVHKTPNSNPATTFQLE